jgi:hypothetical protein
MSANMLDGPTKEESRLEISPEITGRASMRKAKETQPSMRLKVVEFPPAKEEALFEKRTEARLQDLTNIVEKFGHKPFSLFLTENNPVREPIEELIVKEVTLRWIVRVAKRSEGPIRERLWADIDKALIELEMTAEEVMYAGRRWLRSDSLGARDLVVCAH